MPIYKNISDKKIYLSKDGKYLNPGETITTYHFYRDENLQMLDINPYVFPIDLVERVTLVDDTVKEYDVYPAREIHIKVLSGSIFISPNEDFDSQTHKEYRIYEGALLSLDNTQKYLDKIYIKKPDDVPSATFEIIILNNFSCLV